MRASIVHLARRTSIMTAADSARRRDRVYKTVTLVLAGMLVLFSFLIAGRRARQVCCRWVLAIRFPAENLAGLTAETRSAIEAARAEALWRYGELIGVTSGHRSAARQASLFAETVRRTGSPQAARLLVLPPDESRHVGGTAIDVRPEEGARWLEEHGARYGLYRTYENEWWHFEYRPEGRPEILPHPGATRHGLTRTIPHSIVYRVGTGRCRS
jgi:D-alanyl-D-alanine carboxypeptidase